MDVFGISDVPDRIPCHICGRKFNPESFPKHAKVCEKVAQKQRKTFDSCQQRVKGTELAEYVAVRETVPPQSKISWRGSENTSFKRGTPMRTSKLRAANSTTSLQQETNGCSVKSKKSLSVTSAPAGRGKCPYCDRSFGFKAYDRHVEWCKERNYRKPVSAKEIYVAKERLEARTKYRAPVLKPRKLVTKEKYSPKSEVACSSFEDSMEKSVIECKTRKTITKPEVSSSEFFQDEKIRYSNSTKKRSPSKERNFIRLNVLRCSKNSKFPGKQKILDCEKAPDLKFKLAATGTQMKRIEPQFKNTNVNNSGYDPFEAANEQLRRLFEDDQEPIWGGKIRRIPDPIVVPARRAALRDRPSPPPSPPKFLQSSSTSAFEHFSSSEVSPSSSSSGIAESAGRANAFVYEDLDKMVSPCSSVSLDVDMEGKARAAGHKRMEHLLFGPRDTDRGDGDVFKDMEETDVCIRRPVTNEVKPFLIKPPVIDEKQETSTTTTRQPEDHKAKFCHECGAKYPIAMAKFCCECGVRRWHI